MKNGQTAGRTRHQAFRHFQIHTKSTTILIAEIVCLEFEV